jgi:negative regulator of replication initiation
MSEKAKPKNMRVDDELLDFLKAHANWGESLCEVAKRLLGVNEKEKGPKKKTKKKASK